MEYFILTIDKTVKKPISPLGCNNISKGKILKISETENMEYLRVARFTSDKNTEYSDIISSPLYMISNKLKFSIKDYYVDFITLGVQMFDQHNNAFLYWMPALEEVNCVSDKSVFNPDNTIRELVLDYSKISTKKIFTIAKIHEPYIIINLNLAEKILRSDFYGILLKKVRVI